MSVLNEVIKISGNNNNYLIRRFDDLGRIAIPKEIREMIGLIGEEAYGNPMQIYVEDKKIILEKLKRNGFNDKSN